MYNQNQKLSQNFLIPFSIEMLALKKKVSIKPHRQTDI